MAVPAEPPEHLEVQLRVIVGKVVMAAPVVQRW
jgi:hypothetical protein